MNATENLVEEEFAVGEDAKLRVSNISGRIDIRAGEGSTIHMRATKHGRESAIENTWIETSQDGNHVTIRTRGQESGPFNLGRGVCSVDYQITVPAGCEVDAHGVSSDVSVAGTHAPLQVNTVSGDIEIDDVVGSCSISSTSGNTRAERIDGSLGVRTVSGDVTVGASNLPSLNVHSVSGSVTVESPLVSGGHYYAKTVSGDLRLIIPGDTGATVQMKTVSGVVNSGLPAQLFKSGRRNWQGRVNGGGANVELHSVSGDLDLVPNSPIPESQPAAPPDNHAEEVSAVLTQLEQGEIEVDEAMKRIKALR